MKARCAGFTAQPSVYRLSLAPTNRARCRGYKQRIERGEVRLETCAFVRPGRRTMFARHAPVCVTRAVAKEVLKVYGAADRVPVAADVPIACKGVAVADIATKGSCWSDHQNDGTLGAPYTKSGKIQSQK
jgi:hypothetical protein